MATKQRQTRSSVSSKKPVAKVQPRGGKPTRAAATSRVPPAAKKSAKRAAAPTGRQRPVAAAEAHPARRLPRPVDARPVAGPIGSTPPAAVVPAGPSPHNAALEVFERGLNALQQRSFKAAVGLFSSILEEYPDEKELQERARVYLAICERQAAASAREPRTSEERMNAATVAINRGAYPEALKQLRALDRENGENDLVQYMLAVVHAALGETAEAIGRLRAAVRLNPENRFLAAQDADLDPVREHPEFGALLEPPPASLRPAPASRARSGR